MCTQFSHAEMLVQAACGSLLTKGSLCKHFYRAGPDMK